MQALDFILIVLPLGTLVITLVGVVMFIARRQDIKQKKIKHSIEKFSKEKENKHVDFQNEQAELDKMLELNALDQDTHERLSLLIKMNEKKLDETIDALISIENEKKTAKKETVESPPEIEFEEDPVEVFEDLPASVDSTEKPVENVTAKPFTIKKNKNKSVRKTKLKSPASKSSKKKRLKKVNNEPFIIIFDKHVAREQKSVEKKNHFSS